MGEVVIPFIHVQQIQYDHPYTMCMYVYMYVYV